MLDDQVKIIRTKNGALIIKNDSSDPIGSVNAVNLDGITVDYSGSPAQWVESWEVIPPHDEYPLERRMDDIKDMELHFEINFVVLRYPQFSYTSTVKRYQ